MSKFHDQHKTLYYDYKKAMSLEEVNLQYATIRLWWYSSRATSKGTIHKLNNWRDFLALSCATMGRLHVGCMFYQTTMFKFYFPSVLPKF
jgi:hypothetical protein